MKSYGKRTFLPGPRTVHDREKYGEIPDDTPVEIPGKCHEPLSLREDMKRFIREEISKQAVDNEAESFEEANDFDMGDDETPIETQYTVLELVAEPETVDYIPDDTEASADGAEGAEGSEATETPATSPAPNVE